MKNRKLALIAMVSLLVAGCGAKVDIEEKNNTAPSKNEISPELVNLIVETEPSGALGIKELKSSERTDQEVIVTGRIGGRAKPFVEDRAMFMMTDLELKMCAVGEGCATPWDACCEEPETIIENAITVQVKDDSGQIVKQELQGISGLEPFATITVQGTVSEQSDQLLVLNAKSIYIYP